MFALSLLRRLAAAGSLGLLLIAAFVAEARAVDAPAASSWPDGTPQQIREDIFGLRFRMKREIDGDKAGLAFLRSEFERNPKPEVKAFMGWVCIFSDGWGYPEMHEETRGLKLLTEAMNDGSIVACDVLARAKAQGIGGPADPADVIRLMRRAADGGSTRSMARLGYEYSVGYGVTPNSAEAFGWATRAAQLGQPSGLVEIGDAYAQSASIPMAIEYYYRACFYGDTDAGDRLEAPGKAGNADATLNKAVGMVHWANQGAWTPPSLVKQQVKVLEEKAGNNPQALYELGVAHLVGVFAPKDYGAAREYFRRASILGISAARFYMFKMQLLGWGETAQPGALKEIESLANVGIPEAANYWGYIHYWGTSEAGTKRDLGIAFKYVRIAAEKGNPEALMNLAFCYENGIGVPENYALAAKVYWQAYLRGYVHGRDRAKSLLPFVK